MPVYHLLTMKNLYSPTDVAELLDRIQRLTPETHRLWGKMTVTQMLAHCQKSMETAMGKQVFKHLFLGKIIGTLMKPGILSEKPFGKNAPTDKSYVFSKNHHLIFEEEKEKLRQSILDFSDAGPAGCTTHPHPFFGHFTPEQWAVFQWKHLDHHFRQFGV